MAKRNRRGEVLVEKLNLAISAMYYPRLFDYKTANLICLTGALQDILVEEEFGCQGIPFDGDREIESQRIRDLADWWILKLRGESVSRLRKNPRKGKRYKSPPHPRGMAENEVRKAGYHDIKYMGKRDEGEGPLQVFQAREDRDNQLYLIGVGRQVVTDRYGRSYGDVVKVRVLGKLKPKGPKQLKLFKNPRGSDIYDPREEQLRAQRQAIYESSLLRDEPQLKFKSFRNSKGERLDQHIIEEGDFPWLQKYIGKKMFRIGVGVQKRDGRLKRKDGYLSLTAKTIGESKKRYADVDKLVRNRQDYEESLALMRKSTFYRVTPEPTREGLKYFVWPMQPGQRLPKGFTSKKRAENVANLANRDAPTGRSPRGGTPTVGGAWWKPPKKKYTKRELADWLPPADIWRKK